MDTFVVIVCHLNPDSSDFGDVCALYAPFLHWLTTQSSLFEFGCPVLVVACVARKLRPCPSYSRRRDRINLGHWRSLYKGGGGTRTCVCGALADLLAVPSLREQRPCQSNRGGGGVVSTTFGLRVRLGGRHGGSATSCFCADPCVRRVQDLLNRLTCFHNVWMGSPAREGGGGGVRGTSANPRHSAAPRPRASDRCKPGHQGSPPQASPRGDGGQRGLAQRVKRPRLGAIARPQRAVFSLWASPDRQQ